MGGDVAPWIEIYEEAVSAILAGDLDRASELSQTETDDPRLVDSLGRITALVEKKRALREAQWRAAEEIGRGVERETVLDDLYRAFRGLIDFDRLAYAQVSTESIVETVWVRAEGTSDAGVGYHAPLRSGSLQQLLQSNSPRHIGDLQRYLDANPTSTSTRQMLRFGIRSSLTCPLVTADRPVGFLFFSSANAGAFGDESAQAVRPLLGPVAHALSKSELYQELTRMREALTAANRRLSSMARSDALTGIANRRHFDEAIGSEVARAQRFGTPLALLMVDIDFFKNFNDMRGHYIGDDALRLVASTLVREVRRDGDLAARYGGEEFAVVLPQTTIDAAIHVARRIIRSTAQLEIPHPASPYGVVTVSVGISALRPQDQGDALTLIAAADGALYRAKSEGRNRLHADVISGLHRIKTGPQRLKG